MQAGSPVKKGTAQFKLLSALAVVLILGTIWFALRSHEEFPFLLFGMYSQKEEPQQAYIAYSIVVNGKEMIYQNLPDAQHELVVSSLSHAIALGINPLANTEFINWLRSYAANGQPMEIYKLSCVYNEDGKPEIKKRELIYPNDQR